jgi:hypothetical protein
MRRRDSVVGSHASSLARTWVSYLYLAVASALSLLQPFEVPVVVSALLLRPAHIGVAPRFERRTSDERKIPSERLSQVESAERFAPDPQSMLELISRCNTPTRDRELIQARLADADAFSSARIPVVRVNAHKMAATATASCVSAKVRIAPAKRAADLARIPRRVSRAAARRARDGKPLPAGPSARTGSARVSRGNAPLTLPIPSVTLPCHTAGAPRHQGHRAFPRRLRREARGTFGPTPNATIRNTASRNLRKPSHAR